MVKKCLKCNKTIRILEASNVKGDDFICLKCGIKDVPSDPMHENARIYIHPNSDKEVEVFEGFNFAAFFLGVIWFLFKGMIGAALITFVIASIATIYFGLWGLVIFWAIIGFIANDKHEEYLLGQGYKLKRPKRHKNKGRNTKND